MFWRIKLTSSTHLFDSAAVGSSNLIISHNNVSVNGYIFNIPNWSGGAAVTFAMADRASASSGVVNNPTGGAAVFLFQSTLGVGSGNPMLANGLTQIARTTMGCPITLSSALPFELLSAQFLDAVTFSSNSNGLVSQCNFVTGATTPITMSSSAAIDIADTIIDTSSNPSIAGSGAGILTLSGITFLDDDNIAGTLTLASGTSYSGTLKTDYTDGGFLFGQGAATNVVASAAPTNGQLPIGSTGTDPVISTLTAGTNIAITNAAGSITINAIGGTNWIEVTGTSDTMVIDTGYISNNAGLVTLTLPATIAVGETVRVAGKGAGGWKIAQNAGQRVR